ncbi:hypothetical protein B7Z17_04620, partial [Candidatus Saccharibacteria bacterium 32-49-10]
DADEGEDKLEKGARREGKTAWEVAEFYAEDFLEGIKKLNLLTPTHITKATEYIDQQLALVRTLKEKGYTYQITDGIYFDTSKFSSYADFAHLVSTDIIDEIHEALAADTGDKLSPVFHSLGGRHSFETIRLVRLMRK